MIQNGFVSNLRDIVEEAEKKCVRLLTNDQFDGEDSITAGLFYGIDTIIRESRGVVGSLRVQPRIIRGTGWNAPEKRFGADGAVILDYRLPDFTMKKGILIQFKRAPSPAIKLGVPTRNYPRPILKTVQKFVKIRDQCSKMLSITHASFLVIYGEPQFAVVPALSVAAIPMVEGKSKSYCLHAKSLGSFFADFGMCFIGDTALFDVTDEHLERRMQENSMALVLRVTKNDARSYQV